MILYYAGLGQSRKVDKVAIEGGVKSALLSFYFYKGSLQDAKQKFENIFIDSGGFTVRLRGGFVDVKAYGQFLVDNKQFYTVAANLDTNDWDESQANFEYLYNLGVNVIPVYHMGDYIEGRRDVLDDWCKKYKYIAIGGYAGTKINMESTQAILDFCFKKLIPNKVKAHGFGMTSLSLVKRYPFYSVDSTSWMASARYGIVNRWEGFQLKGYQFRDKHIIMRKGVMPEKYSMYQRLYDNVREFQRMETDVTKLWQSRGMEYWI